MQPLRLAKEAVNLVHLPDRGFGPSILGDDALYLLAHGVDMFRVGG
jgi:hypothetical protein